MSLAPAARGGASRVQRGVRRAGVARGPRVLLDPGCLTSRNLGDLAMLHVAVGRVRAAWPGADLRVFTRDAAELARHVPDVRPVSHAARELWLSDGALLGALGTRLPPAARALVARSQSAARARAPGLMSATVRVREWARGRPTSDLAEFRRAVREADLYVVCGQGLLTDSGSGPAAVVLGTALEVADRGVPVAFVGQGIGPVGLPWLAELAGRALRRAALVALRERLHGAALMRAWSVPDDRVVVTGDDAIEFAVAQGEAAAGRRAIGVHARVSNQAVRDRAVLGQLRGALHAAADRFGAPLLPLPVAHHRDGSAYDPDTIREVLGDRDVDHGGSGIGTPAALVDQVHRCRVVVTGAYHAAVFALSAGIPAVLLGRSEYYLDKFTGLADMFGAGCTCLNVDAPDLPERLAAAIDRAWASADDVGPELRAAAARQIAAGRAAFDRLRAWVPVRDAGGALA